MLEEPVKLFDNQIEFTDEAVKQIDLAAIGEEKFPVALRIGCKGGGCSGFMYVLEFTDEIDPEEDSIESIASGLKVVVDFMSLQYLKGVTIDYVKSLNATGFKFTNPGVKKTCGCQQSFSV